MEQIFISLLNTSITAGYLVIAVMLLRPILKKAPKYIRCILWGLVGLRLVLPFSFESVLSLIPSAETIPPEIVTSPTPTIYSGFSVINSAVNPVISQSMAPTPEASVNPMQVVMRIAWIVWLLGVIAMVIYSVVSFVMLKRKLREAVQEGGNVWVCDRVSSPFLLGLFRPRIYLPSDLKDEDKVYVLAHENAHIRRKDHWWKPLGFLLLTVYWFNPLMWVAYIFLCRDIEFACDEKVIKELGNDCKKPYSEALISCSVPRKMISACPVAFGEDGVKGRIKSVLNYKKPAFWIILIAIILCVVVAVCFLTNPRRDADILGNRFETGKCLYSNVISKEKETESNELIFDFHANGETYKEAPATMREFLGTVIQSDYTEDELNDKLLSQSADSGISLGRIKNTYEILNASGQREYVFFQKANGNVVLVSFFSDGNIMNVFRLEPSEECPLKDTTHNYRFRAKVVEIYEDSLLVEPVEEEEALKNAEQVIIRLNGKSPEDYRIGCIVEVIYDSRLEESMPPIIPNASSIFNLDMLSSYFPDPYYSFTATVTEVLDDCIIVKYQHFPLHNFEFSYYQVNTDPAGFIVGDKVNISYDGTVTEAEPYDILGEVYSIEIVTDYETITNNITINGQEFASNRFTISAGTYHTVGIKRDGTVAAWGSDTSGCCNVDAWKNIVSVSAGPAYTAGLTSDGTVVVTGLTDDSFNEVSNWQNIVAISAGAGHMVGLKSDGTVSAVGYDEYDQCNVDGWSDIVAVSAGLYHTVGIKSDGTVVATGWNRFGQCDTQNWQNIVAISAGDYHTVGLKSDGTVVATGWEETGRCDVEQWTDIIAVSAGSAHTVGLKSDGTVVAVGNDEFRQCRDVKYWSNIVAISAGWRHTVGITADGSVVSVGRDIIEQETPEPTISYLDQLKQSYPQFFGLDTFKGLEVYVWKNGDWRCGVRSGTNRSVTPEELWAFGGGATLDEMALILSTYGITRDEVAILYSYDPAFSGAYPNVPTTEQQAYIEDTLFAYLPQRLATEPYIAPEFQVQKQYPLIVYGYQMAENYWQFKFYKNTTIADSIQDAVMGLAGLSLEDAKKKLAEYDLPPEEIPVILVNSYISSYYYEINEQTTIEARMILGLIKVSVSDEPAPTETEPTIEVEPESSGNRYALENGFYSLSGSGKDYFATPYIFINTAKKTANIGGSPLMSYSESGRYFLFFDRLIVKAQNTTYTFRLLSKDKLVLVSDGGYDKSPIPASGTYVFCGEYPS